MPTSEHTIVINQPIDLVFLNTTCMRGCVKWLSSLVAAEKLGDEPVHVGTQYHETYRYMGTSGESVITINTYNPPYEFGFDDPSPVFPLSFHYTFEEVPGGTRVHSRMTLGRRDTGSIDFEVVAGRVQKQFDHDLQNLKEMLESGVQVRVE